jgi:hypothetical protein
MRKDASTKRTGVVAQLALAICAGAAHGQSTVGWPETVDRLNQQRSQAVACLELLKDSGDAAAIRKGRFIYKSAKSFSDGVISGFTVALVEGYKPDKLPPLQAHLELAGKGLKDVCNAAVAAAQTAEGSKGIAGDLARGAVGPVVTTLKELAKTLWEAHVEQNKLEVETIKGQLEAAKWPDFDGGLGAAQSRHCVLPNGYSCPVEGMPIGSKCECIDANGHQTGTAD